MRGLRLAVCAALGALCLPAGAPAHTLHTVFQDDDLSLFSPQSLPSYIRTLKWLGVDYLRVSAEWKIEAPNPNSPRVPPGLRASDPTAYTSPGMQWLDQAVRAAEAEGISVIVDPAFSAPLWATTNTRSRAGGDPWYQTNIDVNQLVAWESMLARRYSGQFTPPGESSPLPRVQAFTLWNEPNGAGFLQPQWRGRTPVSADWYRQLASLAYPAIKQASPSATVLIGNTSDAGGDPGTGHGGVPPIEFIQRLACVDAQLRPLTDGSCAHFHAIPADGYAHHPYERDAPPWAPSTPQQVGWAQMGDLPKLQALLDRLVGLGRLAPGAKRLWLTEQGYESNAELRDRPWTEAQQAQLNAEAEYLAWRAPGTLSFAQFLLRDSRTVGTAALRLRSGNPRASLLGTWTTGLERESGVAKPALWMFRSPVVARVASAAHLACLVPGLARGPRPTAAELVEIWGRARPLRSASVVGVLLRGANGTFEQNVPSDEAGIFDTTLAVPASSGVVVSFRWRAPGQSWQNSPVTAPVPIPVAYPPAGG